MRMYATKTIPASIQQKADIPLKYGKPLRSLTAEDFEIVPEHDEERLVQVCCDVCGIQGEYSEETDLHNCESSLLSLQVVTADKVDPAAYDEITGDFFEGYWYEVCESCMRYTIVPYLNSIRKVNPIALPVQQPEEEPALLSETEASVRRNGLSSGALIGGEERSLPTLQLPPISDDEPF